MQDFITNSTPVNLLIIGAFIIIALILILKAVKELSFKFGNNTFSFSSKNEVK